MNTSAGPWEAVLFVLLGLAVLVLAVTLIVYLIRRMIFDAEQRHNDPAEAELRRRYAEGHIGAEEYHKRLADLRAR